MKKIKMAISLPVSIFKEGKNYVAFTPALDLSTSASSYAQAKERFGEAVLIFMEEIAKQGRLENNLENLGWEKNQKRWTPPITVSQSLENFNIPIPMIA